MLTQSTFWRQCINPVSFERTTTTPIADALQLRNAATRLLAVMHATDEPMRLAVLKRVARGNGELAFPCFLKILLIIAESNNEAGKRIIADTIAQGLRSMDLPTGNLTAWGASHLWQPGLGESFLAKTLATSPTRRLGPVEYLTVWYCQKTQRPYLSTEGYQYSLAGLIGMINLNSEASELYPRKILNDISSAHEGAYTRSTRARLKNLSGAWLQGMPPEAIALLN